MGSILRVGTMRVVERYCTHLGCNSAAGFASALVPKSVCQEVCVVRFKYIAQPSSTASGAPDVLARERKHTARLPLFAHLRECNAGFCSAAADASSAGGTPPPPPANDVSLLHVGAVNALFAATPASPERPVPLPLGPAYNLSTGCVCGLECYRDGGGGRHSGVARE